VFVDNAYGGTGTFTHDLSERAPLSLAYRFSVTHVDASDVYFCVDYGVCDAATRSALRARARLSPVSLTAQIDRSDDPLNPMTGYQVRAELQHASQFTASDFRYNRAYATGSAYRPVGHAVLAFNARVGVVSAIGSTGAAIGDTSGNILHPTVRFYAGGAQSVRGFGENQLGPRVLTIAPEQLRGRVVANGGRDTTYLFCPPPRAIATCDPNASLDTVINGKPARLHLTDNVFSPQPLGGRTLLEGSVEYRFPLFGNFGGAVFVDGGVVGEGNLGAATSGTSAITPGFGVRYYSPVGPIRIDIGLNPLTTERLTVLTEDPTTRSIVVVTGPPGAPRGASDRIYAPARTEGGFQGLLNRISLHLSIGQAF
jgi:outer membrane protein insertion porin family